jgi:hypothetical protein
MTYSFMYDDICRAKHNRKAPMSACTHVRTHARTHARTHQQHSRKLRPRAHCHRPSQRALHYSGLRVYAAEGSCAKLGQDNKGLARLASGAGQVSGVSEPAFKNIELSA